jgi:hypothetical protein
MPTLFDLSPHLPRTFTATLYHSLLSSYPRQPVFAQAQHSEFMFFTNIRGRFTFFCKNISTDPHSEMSRVSRLAVVT